MKEKHDEIGEQGVRSPRCYYVVTCLACGEMARTEYNERQLRQSTEAGRAAPERNLRLEEMGWDTDQMGCRETVKAMFIGSMFVGACCLVTGSHWYYKGLCEDHALIYVYVYICMRFINDDSRQMVDTSRLVPTEREKLARCVVYRM